MDAESSRIWSWVQTAGGEWTMPPWLSGVPAPLSRRRGVADPARLLGELRSEFNDAQIDAAGVLEKAQDQANAAPRLAHRPPGDEYSAPGF